MTFVFFCDAILCPFFYASFIEDNYNFQFIQLFCFLLSFLSFLPSIMVYSVVIEFLTHLLSFFILIGIKLSQTLLSFLSIYKISNEKYDYNHCVYYSEQFYYFIYYYYYIWLLNRYWIFQISMIEIFPEFG